MHAIGGLLVPHSEMRCYGASPWLRAQRTRAYTEPNSSTPHASPPLATPPLAKHIHTLPQPAFISTLFFTPRSLSGCRTLSPTIQLQKPQAQSRRFLPRRSQPTCPLPCPRCPRPSLMFSGVGAQGDALREARLLERCRERKAGGGRDQEGGQRGWGTGEHRVRGRDVLLYQGTFAASPGDLCRMWENAVRNDRGEKQNE